MSGKLKIRLAARCEAAGRPNNEDNFQVEADLSTGKGFHGDEVLTLGDKGALLLVCDGMGGMNAGEVASKIAVDTVKQRFVETTLANEVLKSDESCCDFIRRVIQEADANIKKESKADEAKSGMGSTIVLAWLLDKKVYVGWCGDSRAYKYNPQRGLIQLSHDHSYVQELVDSGQLSPELAFDHPNNNIITRSLGDPRGAVKPDVKCYSLEENDVLMLCSDGLCGVLRDHEIDHLIASNMNSMVSCRDALWEAARAAGWHDNVTIALAQIMPKDIKPTDTKPVENKPLESAPVVLRPNKMSKAKNRKYIKVCCAILAVLLVVLALVLAWKYSSKQKYCKQFEPVISNYEKLSNPLDDKGMVIKDVVNILDSIKNNGCEKLKSKVLNQTGEKIKIVNKTIDELENNGLKDYADRIRNGDELKNLNKIKDELK